MKFFAAVLASTCLLCLGHCENLEKIRRKIAHDGKDSPQPYVVPRSQRVDRSVRVFNYPTRYSVGSLGTGNILPSKYSFGKIGNHFGTRGYEYGNGGGNFILQDYPQYGQYGSGISTEISGSGRLNSGVGLAGGSARSSNDYSGYGQEYQSEFAKGDGSTQGSDHEAAIGAEGEKGYKAAEDYDKGEKGVVDKSQHSGKHSSAIGKKKGEEEAARVYVDKESAAKGHKGENYAKSEGQKKGHKTSGFHNVYHKNEYKKDTTFYDDEHNHAESEEYGGEHSQHAKADGAREKVEKVATAYQDADRAEQGAFTNGHQYGVAQGHDRSEAEKKEYEKAAEYAKKAKHKEGQEHGSSSGSSFFKKIH